MEKMEFLYDGDSKGRIRGTGVDAETRTRLEYVLATIECFTPAETKYRGRLFVNAEAMLNILKDLIATAEGEGPGLDVMVEEAREIMRRLEDK